MNNRTAVSGFLQTFFLYIALIGIICEYFWQIPLCCPTTLTTFAEDYLPVYFQACKGASPTRSGVLAFGIGFSVPPAAIIGGVSVTRLQKYRPQLWLGWSILVLGLGLVSTVDDGVSVAHTVGYTLVLGSGVGIVSAVGYFPVLAPLPVSKNSSAMAFFIFMRNFAQVRFLTFSCEYILLKVCANIRSGVSRSAVQSFRINLHKTSPPPSPLSSLKEQPSRTQLYPSSVIWRSRCARKCATHSLMD